MARAEGRGERRSGARRDYGQQLFNDVLSMASTLIQSRKEAGAEKIAGFAQALRGFADDLEELPSVRAYAEAAAEGLEEFSEYVARAELSEMLADAEQLARRQPALTLAFTLAAGVAAAQIMRQWRSGAEGYRYEEGRRNGGGRRRGGNGKRNGVRH
jgi:hypothetical protein